MFLKGKKLKTIKVPILNDEYFVYVLLGNKKQVVEWVNGYYEESYSEKSLDVRGKTFYQRGLYPSIWVGTEDHFWATLAHEAIHAVQYIFDEIGEGRTDEVFAHSVGAIVYAVEKIKR